MKPKTYMILSKDTIYKTAAALSTIASVALGTPRLVAAQETLNVLPPANILPRVQPGGLLQGVIRLILIAAFVVAFIFLLVGGVRWIVSGGDKTAVEGARGMVTGALIGLVIVLAAFAIIRLVEIFFGVSIITGGTLEIPNAQSL